jgi:hypothetical protein
MELLSDKYGAHEFAFADEQFLGHGPNFLHLLQFVEACAKRREEAVESVF